MQHSVGWAGTNVWLQLAHYVNAQMAELEGEEFTQIHGLARAKRGDESARITAFSPELCEETYRQLTQALPHGHFAMLGFNRAGNVSWSVIFARTVDGLERGILVGRMLARKEGATLIVSASTEDSVSHATRH